MFAVWLIAGILICGFIVLRQGARTAPFAPKETDRSEPNPLQAVDDWQRRIRLDANPDYTDAMATLRREERRQRPEEGRN